MRLLDRDYSRPCVGQLRRWFHFDARRGCLIWRPRERATPQGRGWNTRYAGKPAGSKARGAIQIRLKCPDGATRNFLAHRVIWALVHGAWPERIIDHVNGDPWDNRLENLRLADSSGNNCNRHVVQGEVPLKGVYFVRSKSKYAVQIKKDGRWYWLGLHESAEAAAAAYDRAAKELHGDFAKINGVSAS